LDILKSVTNKCEVLAMQQAGIGELRVLRDYYDGKLSFTDSEVKQLLQVTGEYGTAYWQRLGIEEESRTTLERLDYALSVAQEALRHWRQRGDRAADRETRAATQMLARSYERIIYHLREAGRHLELA
jgi:hypothetical protein